MRIASLEVSGVRNLESLAIIGNPGLNLFVGPNGAGKSAILEAIYLLGRGRSFRSPSIGPVIQRGAALLRVGAQLDDELRGSVRVRLVRRVVGPSELEVSGQAEKRISEIARLMPVQLMLPDASSVVFGRPEERRRLMDWGTFHVKPGYLDELRAYQRALQQRNAALRSSARRGDAAQLQREGASWEERLVDLGERVDVARRDYLALFTPAFMSQLAVLAPELDLAVRYHPGWPFSMGLADSLSESRLRDVKSGVTHRGPHRADLRMVVGSERAAATLSRGQAKIVASAMRLAQAEVTASSGGRRCLFLIDDVGAELDHEHNERFFSALERLGCQVFATATVALPLSGAFAGAQRQLFHVEQGACHPI